MAVLDYSRWLLGLDQQELTATQMMVRAFLVYISTVAMIRLGERRVLGKNTAFDVILGVVLGSSLSRAINGSADLSATIVAGFFLIALHWIFSGLAYRFPWFGRLVKGRAVLLIEKGERNTPNLRRTHITQRDLEEAARRSAGLDDPEQALKVYLERSGEISFVLEEEQEKKTLRVVDVEIEDGVKTVRVELV